MSTEAWIATISAAVPLAWGALRLLRYWARLRHRERMAALLHQDVGVPADNEEDRECT
jgi:hypothetical protein